MARLTYSAPGVYVEEIPSAQQPIAGVGTSTAAFIGIVPDEIQYPVRNEKYNPMMAAKLATASSGSEVAARIKVLEEQLEALEAALNAKLGDIEASNQSPADKRNAKKEAGDKSKVEEDKIKAEI